VYFAGTAYRTGFYWKYSPEVRDAMSQVEALDLAIRQKDLGLATKAMGTSSSSLDAVLAAVL
jgi:hypothetical protein